MKISGLTSFTFSIMASGWSSEVTGIGWKLRPSNKVFPDASSPGHPDKSTTFGNETLFCSILRLNSKCNCLKINEIKPYLLSLFLA